MCCSRDSRFCKPSDSISTCSIVRILIFRPHYRFLNEEGAVSVTGECFRCMLGRYTLGRRLLFLDFLPRNSAATAQKKPLLHWLIRRVEVRVYLYLSYRYTIP